MVLLHHPSIRHWWMWPKRLICSTCQTQEKRTFSVKREVCHERTISAVQAMAGLCYLCLGIIAFCMSLTAHFMDICISVLVPGSAVPHVGHVEECKQAAQAEKAGQPQMAAVCRGPVGKVLKLGFGMAGAACGISLGCYRACCDAFTNLSAAQGSIGR